MRRGFIRGRLGRRNMTAHLGYPAFAALPPFVTGIKAGTETLHTRSGPDGHVVGFVVQVADRFREIGLARHEGASRQDGSLGEHVWTVADG